MKGPLERAVVEFLEAVTGLPGLEDAPVERLATELRAALDEYIRRAAEIERLRARTHEIQAEEMCKRADLDRAVASWRQMWLTAKDKVADLTAEWATASTSRDTPGSFWGMTSWNNRSTLFRLVGEHAHAVAENERLRAQWAAVLALHPRYEAGPDTNVYEWCGACQRTWPYPTARALGVEEADRG